MRRSLFVLLLCSVPFTALGASNAKRYFALDAGVHMTNLLDRFSVSSSWAGEVSSLKGFARGRLGLHVGKNWYFEPSLGLVLPWRASADGSTKVFPFQIDLPLHIPIFKFLSLRAGPGIYSTATVGNGGTVTLNNGNSTTDFPIASGLRFSFNFTANVGLFIHVSKKLSLGLEAYTLAVLSSTRRQVHASATLGLTL